MELLLWSIALIVALFVLVKSADYFTEGAEKVGLYFGLSSFIVGATIVSIGSSMPELITSTLGVVQGKPSFPIDNVIGSNIANILLIGGISGVFAREMLVKKELIHIDLPFFFLSTSLFIYFIYDGVFTWKEGLASIMILIIFILYTIADRPRKKEDREKVPMNYRYLVYIIGGIVGIYFGAEYTLQSVENIAKILTIPESIVIIFAVAVGTSLPELVISVQAVRKKNYSIAFGNIFGSNTFNALAVTGVPSFFGTLTISNTVLTVGIPFLAIATIGFIFSTMDNKVARWEAIALLSVYIVFTGKVVGIL